MPKWVLVSLVLLFLHASPGYALDLQGSIFGRVGKEERIDPVLLYAVALIESAKGIGGGNIAPSKWALRTPEGAIYPATADKAQAELERLMNRHGGLIDVGLMQVNLRWHGHRVSKPEDLLDPETNVRVGTRILIEAILSSPGDMELGIGRYHSWSDKVRARNYGQRVLAVWQNIKSK